MPWFGETNARISMQLGYDVNTIAFIYFAEVSVRFTHIEVKRQDR